MKVNITTSTDRGGGVQYVKGLHQNQKGYYEGQGILHGLGLEDIGYLVGDEIKLSDISELICNRNPHTGEKLNVRDNRRPYYDVTFNAPKGFSVALNLHPEESVRVELEDAYSWAVQTTMSAYVEPRAQTRVRPTKNADEDRQTGNMIWAEYNEGLSRPVEGISDPHRHTHNIVLNTTFDPVEERRKALQMVDVKRNAPYIEAVASSLLAKRLTELGYSVARTDTGWDLNLGDALPGLVEKFSRRTEQIHEMARELGIIQVDEQGRETVKNPKAMADLAKTTREGKESESEDNLRSTWESWLTDEERAAIANLKQNQDGNSTTNGQALEYAMEKMFERQSVVREEVLLTQALKYGVGSVTAESLKAEMAKRDDIIRAERDGQLYLTTQEVLNEERSMISLAAEAKGKYASLVHSEREFQPIVQDDKVVRFNPQQKAAGHFVWNSNDLVIPLMGAAGTGKTELLRQVVAGIEEEGRKVLAFAPSADASRGVLREAGFEDAETIHQLLMNEEIQEQARNSVILIDEAGLLGARPMNKVLHLARELDARVILSGDTRQHRSVDRGDAMRLLTEEAGIETANVREIVRQNGEYKRAVTALSEGDVEKGFERLERMGAIVEIEGETRHEQLAKDYVEASGKKSLFGKDRTALVVSPTHAEGEAVTSLIRQELKALPEWDRRKLGEEEHEFVQHRNLSLTEAERKDSFSYRAGQIVEYVRSAKGIKAGERFSVVGGDSGSVTVKNSDGKILKLDMDGADRFQVYEQRTLNLAVGDKIRITQNGWTADKEHRLNNGALYDVQGFTKNREGEITGVKLANGWMIDKGYANLAHGYVTTSHASQGKTVDHVFIAQSSQSFSASDLEQFYVSVSRGRRSVSVYTDDNEMLREVVKDSGQRLAATELMKQAQQEKGEEGQERTLMWQRWASWARSYASDVRERISQRYQGLSDSYMRPSQET